MKGLTRNPMRRSVVAALALILALTSPKSFGAAEGESHTGPRKQLTTVVFIGLGGAILGLSTLSFYARPQDRLSNIAIGLAVGIIGGVAYVTYGAVSKSDSLSASPADGRVERFPQASYKRAPILAYQFDF